MRLRKICIVLLALLLAAMATVPIVSAADHHMYSVDWSNVAPTEPIAEKDLLTIIMPQKDSLPKQEGTDKKFIKLPADISQKKADSADQKTNYILQGNVADSEPILVIRLPKKMFEIFSLESKDGNVLLPEEFYSTYPNMVEFERTLKDSKDAIKVRYKGNYTQSTPTVIDLGGSSTRAPFSRYQRWSIFSSDPSGYSTTFISGKIRPSTYSVTGSGTITCQERELHMNRYDGDNDGIDVIEINVGGNTPGYPTGSSSNLNLYPVIYNGDKSGNPIYLGYVPVSTSTLPHNYNYYVQLAPSTDSTTYYIYIQDTASQEWLGDYSYTDDMNPSQYIRDLRVSAELTTYNTASTFDIRVNPIIDEWIRVSQNSDWHSPSYAFNSPEQIKENHPGQMQYVSTGGVFAGSGELITASFIQGTTP
ncbi:MAG: hypothetical protein GYA23_01435 [Methanomicrobiales archaeon]|nr:hypothetical protein [Methanomicrobiales archaeon]